MAASSPARTIIARPMTSSKRAAREAGLGPDTASTPEADLVPNGALAREGPAPDDGSAPTAETRRELVVAEDAAPERLDRVLARAFPDLSRSRLQALIRDGRVAVNDTVVRDP